LSQRHSRSDRLIQIFSKQIQIQQSPDRIQQSPAKFEPRKSLAPNRAFSSACADPQGQNILVGRPPRINSSSICRTRRAGFRPRRAMAASALLIRPELFIGPLVFVSGPLGLFEASEGLAPLESRTVGRPHVRLGGRAAPGANQGNPRPWDQSPGHGPGTRDAREKTGRFDPTSGRN
jgi:hypothetical protein